MKKIHLVVVGTFYFLFLLMSQVTAGEVTGLTNFTANTPARAAEVNGNFATVKTAVDDNNTRITQLEQTISTLHNTVSELQNSLTIANNAVIDLQNKLASVSVETINDYPTVRFTGVNLQVVNGLDSTDSANGTGNIIAGYNEIDTTTAYRCTIGISPSNGLIITDQSECILSGGLWGNTGFKTGSHYLVAGTRNNYSFWGGVVTGLRNTSNGAFTNLIGGNGNTASGIYSSVNGGWRNIAGGAVSSISGGKESTTIGNYSVVSGGSSNNAIGEAANVSGGYSNTAYGANSSVSGGRINRANNPYSSVSGGYGNQATAEDASVSGGNSNTASGASSSVSGGSHNIASGVISSISGGGNQSLAGGNVADTAYSSILGGIGQNTNSEAQTIPSLP